MGVAEWRLKINQPSLFQFVRKQKQKEIIKRERRKGKIKRAQRGEGSHTDPKCRVRLEKPSREVKQLGRQKGKSVLKVLFAQDLLRGTARLPGLLPGR